MTKLSSYLNPRNILLGGTITLGIALSACGGEVAPTDISLKLKQIINGTPSETKDVSRREPYFALDIYRTMTADGVPIELLHYHGESSFIKRGSHLPAEDCTITVGTLSRGGLRYHDFNCDGELDFANLAPGSTQSIKNLTAAGRRTVYDGYQLALDTLLTVRKTNFHQKLNPHMYSENGMLRPRYVPREL